MERPRVTLELPTLSRLESYLQMVKEFVQHGTQIWEGYLPLEGESGDRFVRRLLEKSVNPEPPMVPETTYWAVCDQEVAGRISLRHRLSGSLARVGGHIGYEVAPRFRRRGIATEMLRLILLTEEARKIGRLLLTCSPENVASNKTILANGGRLTQTIWVDENWGTKNHYWIELDANGPIDSAR